MVLLILIFLFFSSIIIPATKNLSQSIKIENNNKAEKHNINVSEKFSCNAIEKSWRKANRTIQTNSEVCSGYTLLCLSPIYNAEKNLVLVNMNGTIIHKWDTIDMWGKMLPGGAVIGPSHPRDGYVMGREFKEVVQEEWDGTITWNFSDGDDDNTGTPMARAHHDLQRIKNPVYYTRHQDYHQKGNTLILAHYNKTVEYISYKEIVDDVIYEVDWNGNRTDFSWHAADHIEEMGFTEFTRFGIYFFPGYPIGLPKPIRHLFDIKNDWLHINALSVLGKNRWYENGDERFHPDNILISSRHANFLAIISKKTGHIVWRVGPDYSENTMEGIKIGPIIGPHNVHMVPDGLPGAGNILVFDNGGIAGYGPFGMPCSMRLYSRVIEFNPVTLDIEWEYTHRIGSHLIPRGKYHKFFSGTVSSAQRLPNGNTLITEGRSRRVFEVNRQQDILWELIWPYDLYRSYRIPPQWVPGNPSDYEYWN